MKRENYRHAVGTCERCHTRIEPLISLQWWCKMEEPARPAIEALRERTVRFHPESQHRFAIASLEEIPDWCLSRQLWWGHQLPIWTTPDGEAICAVTEEEAQERAGAGVRADPRSRRPRHVVLVGALAVRDARLAGRDAGARGVLPRERQLDGARDHPPLGEPHDLGGARGDGRGAVHGRDHPLDRARDRRATDVEEPRHGRRPARDDRRTRRGRDALRAAQDLVDAGRALLAGRDRGGPQAREQALERLPPDPPERRGRRASRRADSARGALDPRPHRRRARAGRGGVGGVRLRDRGEHALSPDVRRLLRLVRGGDQAAPLRARADRRRDGARCARAAARAAAPDAAARHRGDLVAPSRRAEPPDRVGLARARRALPRRRRRARARAGGGGHVPAQRRPGGARLRRRAADLRSGRPAGAPEGRRATPAPRSRACGRRSPGRRRCSPTSGSSRAPRRPSSTAEREKLDRFRRELEALSGTEG